VAVAKLGRTIAHYPWGGSGAISDLFGWAPSNQPEAEWWLGVHPVRPSTLSADGSPLSQWLQRYEAHSDLPYLFKVLAPTMPLSLQVHPSTEQAERGFDEETAAKVPLDSSERLFRDRFAKPELVVALEGGFQALAGVREVDDTVAALQAIAGSDDTPAIDDLVARLEGNGVGDAVRWLLSGDPGVDEVIAELTARATRDDTLSRVCEHFPGDPGVAIALLLHRVDLEPGEALFVEAGVPHAYLSGFAVELMAPSDNVLRGGLTGKHVDTEAFLDIARFEPGPLPTLSPQPASGRVEVYQPPGYAFHLSHLAGDTLDERVELTGPSIALCTSGRFQLRGPRGSVTAERGDAWVLSQSESPVVFEGSGELWWASAR